MGKNKRREVIHTPRIVDEPDFSDLSASGACVTLGVNAETIMAAQRNLYHLIMGFPHLSRRAPIALHCHTDSLGDVISPPDMVVHQGCGREVQDRMPMRDGAMLIDPYANSMYAVFANDSIPVGLYQFVLPNIPRLS